MALVTVTNVTVKNANPCPILNQFSFDVTFKCLAELKAPLVWNLIYVGSPTDKNDDQLLECIKLDALKPGNMRFNFSAPAPNFQLIKPENVHGATVLLLEVSYLNHEFVRIGWYIHNSYIDEELEADPPLVPQLDKLCRYIVADQPRVTRFNINWFSEEIPPESIDEKIDKILYGQEQN